MTRRTWAGLLAAALVIGVSVVALTRPVPYVTFAPGPTVNVLGGNGEGKDSQDIITVKGHRSYRDRGGLRLTTVIPSGPQEKVSIPGLVTAWIDPDRAVYPYRAIYQTQDTRASVRQQSSVEMVSSQDNAVAAALKALDIPFRTAVKVADVQKGGPAAGKLETGDYLLAIDGRPVTGVDQVTSGIRRLPVGSKVRVKVERKGRTLQEKLTTTTSTVDRKSSAVRVSIAPTYRFPFDVKLNLAQNIGGPSGGMMFALGIYDVLTPGSLTDGRVIAGTGEIDAAGKVGEIGGIQQKLVGAQDDGARLFLVPAGNCAEALGGHYDPKKMRLVKVTTLDEAIKDVKAWVKDPQAKLARCTK